MTKSKTLRTILIVACIMILVGVFVLAWMLMTAEERNVIRVSLEMGDSKPVVFEALDLVPGDSRGYEIRLVKEGSDKYDLRIDFVETGDGTLKNYARVKIIAHGEAVYDDLLANALESESIVLAVDFKEKQNTEFQVVYYLPPDVGNEAKNAEAKVGLLLTASNE